MSEPTSTTPRGSSFAWEAEQRFALLFLGFVLLSLGAHVAAFFLFQVAYPQRVTIPPPAAQVTVLDPDIPEHRPVLAWIAAEDPALSANIAQAKPPGLAPVAYKPSFDTTRSWPKPAPRASEPVTLPAGRAGLSLLESTLHPVKSSQQALPPAPTSISISGPLATIPLQTPLPLPGKTQEALTPAQFLVGVDAKGIIQHAMLQRSSGNDTVDQEAAENLTKLKFATGDRPIIWGFLTISWGDDILIRDPEGTSREVNK